MMLNWNAPAPERISIVDVSGFIHMRVFKRQSEMSLALSVMFFSGAIFALLTATVFPAENGPTWFRVLVVATAALIAGLAVMITGKKLTKPRASVIAIMFIAILLILTSISVTAIRGVVWGMLIVVLVIFFAWFMSLWTTRIVAYCSLTLFATMMSIRHSSSDVYLISFAICLLSFVLIEVFGRFKQNLHNTSLTDHLCQVWNRAGLEVMLQREIRSTGRTGAPLSLLFIDLDGFKQINDHHGHLAGDRVLQAISTALRNQVRPTDTVARIGGDEFVLVLPNTGAATAEQLATRLRSSVSDCKWTYGVAEFVAGESAVEFLDRSDREMLAWKRTRASRSSDHVSAK